MDLLTALTRLPVNESAPLVLGSRLVFGGLSSLVVEVEAYGGGDDPASHAFRGQTQRNRTMFGPAGFAYVYLNYGCHWMLNISAGPPGVPGAVLVRAAIPMTGLEEMSVNRRGLSNPRALLSGPGKLCQAYRVDGTYNGHNLLDPASVLRIEPAAPVGFVASKRIGLSQGKGDQTPWRFVSSGHSDWSSRPPGRR